MFDYFRNSSSNPHQICCEDSPTNGLYNSFESDDLALRSRSQRRFKLDKCLTCSSCTIIAIYRTVGYVNYGVQTWHDSKLMHGIYAHDRVDDLDFDSRSQWLGRATKSALNYLGN